MPLRRRRPVRRAAVTGAVGYAAYNKGKKSGADQTQATPHPVPDPDGEAAAEERKPSRLEIYEELAKLGELKEKGLLTDAEFERENSVSLAERVHVPVGDPRPLTTSSRRAWRRDSR